MQNKTQFWIDKTIDEILQSKPLTAQKYKQKAIEQILTSIESYSNKFLDFVELARNNESYKTMLFEKVISTYNLLTSIPNIPSNIININESDFDLVGYYYIHGFISRYPDYPFSQTQWDTLFSIFVKSDSGDLKSKVMKIKNLNLPLDYKDKLFENIIQNFRFKELENFWKVAKRITTSEREIILNIILDPPKYKNKRYKNHIITLSSVDRSRLAVFYLQKYPKDKYKEELFDIGLENKPLYLLKLINKMNFSNDQKLKLAERLKNSPTYIANHIQYVEHLFDSKGDFKTYMSNTLQRVIDYAIKKQNINVFDKIELSEDEFQYILDKLKTTKDLKSEFLSSLPKLLDRHKNKFSPKMFETFNSQIVFKILTA